jgi:hypothetical protein
VKFGLQPISGFNIDSPQFQWLVDSMMQFNEFERAMFLRWIIGVASLTAGFRGLRPRIKVGGM